MGPRGVPLASPQWRSEGGLHAGPEDCPHVRHAQEAGPQAGCEMGTDPGLICCPGVTAFSGPAGPASPEMTVPQLSLWARPPTFIGSLNVAPPRGGGRVRGGGQQGTTGLKSLDLKLGFSSAKLVLVHLS